MTEQLESEAKTLTIPELLSPYSPILEGTNLSLIL